MAISLYTGAGIHDADVLEGTVRATNQRMHDALDRAGVPHHFRDYGRPAPGSLPYNCDGGHNFTCWNYALSDALPRMMDVLEHP